MNDSTKQSCALKQNKYLFFWYILGTRHCPHLMTDLILMNSDDLLAIIHRSASSSGLFMKRRTRLCLATWR